MSTNSKTRILIAGLGSVGRRHLKNLQSLGYSDFVFYRTNRGTLEDETPTNWPYVTELTSALAFDPKIAVISNPTALHVDVAIAAARAGCHLFIEKPLSNSTARSDELREIVHDQGLITMIGCQFRFHPLLIRLRELLNSGKLGTVFAARAEWGEYLPDWHSWEDYRNGYAARADLGGGVVLTLIHPLDYVYWLFGDVERVHASTRKLPHIETKAESWADITLELQSGIVAHVHVDYAQRPPVHRLTVWGELGHAVWDYYAGSLTCEMSDGRIETQRVRDAFDRNEMFMHEMAHFLDCVDRRQPTSIPLKDGIAVLDIALRAKANAEPEYTYV